MTGHLDDSEEQEFLPLFASPQVEPAPPHGYYSVAREPRLPSNKARRDGPRSGYVATELFLSLVDAREAPYRGDLRQLSAQIRCTNRDLPLFMPVGQAQGELSFGGSAPLEKIQVVAGPSRPQSAMREGGIAWRLLGLLSLNYLSLLDSDAERGALTLRELLSLFAHGADVGIKRQIDGVRSVGVRPVVRRHPVPGPIAFGRGLEIRVTVDDLSFEGGSAVLLGSVLHHYFARHVSMNSFAQTVLASMTRGDVMTWAPRQRREGRAVNDRHVPADRAGDTGGDGAAAQARAVEALFTRLQEKPAAFDLFQALRRIENASIPTSRASATRCARAKSRSASPRTRR